MSSNPIIALSTAAQNEGIDLENYLLYLIYTGGLVPPPAAALNVVNLYVDGTYGNDSTALPNRFDKPYLTVAAAITAAVAGQVVYIRKGNYLIGTQVLKNGVNIYCENDVIIDGGFSDGAVAVNCKIFGNAKFSSVVNSPAAHTLTILAGSTITFEFDTISTNLAFNINPTAGLGTANILITGNSIVLTGYLPFGFGSSIRGTSNVNIKIRDIYSSLLFNFFFRSAFSGTVNIFCPNMINTFQGLGLSGCGIIYSITGGFVNGSIINFTGNITLTNAIAGVNANACISSEGSIMTVNGNLTALNSHCVHSIGRGAAGSLTVNGNMSSNLNAAIVGNSLMTFLFQNGILKTNGLDVVNPQVIAIGVLSQLTGNNVNVRNCRLYNALPSGSIVKKENLLNVLNLYNCEGFSSGVGGNFILATAAQLVGFHNVRSNKDNTPVFVTDTFVPSGFIFDSTFIMPTI